MSTERLLTATRFQQLADVPPEIEWFANLGSKATRRAYETALGDFMQFAGIRRPEEFRGVTRAHVIAWRDDLVRRELGGSTVRHRRAALSEDRPVSCLSCEMTADFSVSGDTLDDLELAKLLAERRPPNG